MNNTCLQCNKDLSDKAKNLYDSFCSLHCFQVYDKEHTLAGDIKDIEHLNKYDKGSLGEVSVCADLMRKGITVFRNAGKKAPFDLVALIEGELLRIEVKSGRRNSKTNKIYCGDTKDNDFDILAVYDLGTGQVYYIV